MHMTPIAEIAPSEDDAAKVDFDGLAGRTAVPVIIWGNKKTGKVWVGDWRFPFFATHWARIPTLMP
jgi:hypothetical protein